MSEKGVKLRFLVLFLLLLTVFGSSAQKVNTVVLDAGHGGHDTGALGKNSREKDITLSIVLKLRDYIKANLKDVKIILTRDSDYFVELYRRAKIANENKADLFISVHCNSIRSTAAYGSETFVMGLYKSDANLQVAKTENSAILLEKDYVEKYDGFDPQSPEGNIFFSMMQNNFLDRSLDFAGKVQKQLVNNLGMYNRGIKQAGFWVLYKTAMPGVLIETGFISNPDDEKFLLSQAGQDKMAKAIFNAFRDYKYGVERTPVPSVETKEISQPAATEKIEQQAVQPVPVPVEKPVQIVPEPVKQKVEPVVNVFPVVSYRVQFAISNTDKPVTCNEFRKVPDIKKYVQNRVYKYTSGNFGTLEEALNHRLTLIKMGYKDAFVVVFNGEQRITIDEAKALGEKKQ